MNKLVDCRPGQQRSNGQLDYLLKKDEYPQNCKCCGIQLPMFREDPKQDICNSVGCVVIELKEEAYGKG